MEIFKLNTQNLIFTCDKCGANATAKQSKLGCKCGNKLFKVARYMKLIENPLTPYHTDEEEDGPKLNTPGDISTNMGGIPRATIQDVKDPDANLYGRLSWSEDITLPDNIRDINIKQKGRSGVHNMNAVSINKLPTNVFERTRNRLRYKK